MHLVKSTSYSDTAFYTLANFPSLMTEDSAILFGAGKLRVVAGPNRTREIPRHQSNWPGCPLTAVDSKIKINRTCSQIMQQIAKELVSGSAICNEF
jgi:hypothetical protein